VRRAERGVVLSKLRPERSVQTSDPPTEAELQNIRKRGRKCQGSRAILGCGSNENCRVCKDSERVVTSDEVVKTGVMNKIERDNAFSSRLKKVFEFATMSEVGKRLNVPHATVRNYYLGRLPAPDILIKIANETGVSLTWLLTGKGDMFATGHGTKNYGQALEQLINEIVDRRLAEIEKNKRRSSSKNIPAFDIDVSVGRHNDPKLILTEWYEFDGEKPPKDFGVVFFRGWETFTSVEKVEAIRDARRVLDRAKEAKK